MIPSVRAGRATREWLRSRRLTLRGISGRTRVLAIASLCVAAMSAVVVVAVGAGWEPPGGAQPAAFGGTVPRFLIPFSCAMLGTLAVVVVIWAADAGTAAGWGVRFAVGLAGAALMALTVVSGWVAAFYLSTALARIAAWVGMACAGLVAAAPPRIAARRPRVLATLAAFPFVVTLAVWLLSSSGPIVALPDGAVWSARDVFAQSVVTLVGSLAAAVGVTLLWSIALSTHQARDMARAVVAATRGIRVVPGVLLGVKVAALVTGYAGWVHWDEGAFTTSRSDSWTGWLIGLAFIAAGVWWWSRPARSAPGPAVTATVVRWVGLGFAFVFAAAVTVGLAASVMTVWPSNGPANGLNRALGWLISSDPPVPLWAIVVTVVLTALAVPALRSRAHRWTAVVLAVWMLPRAVELVFLIRGHVPPVDPPSAPTMDMLVTGALVILAALWWWGRQRWASPRAIVILLVASTLVAHPFLLLPSAWTTGVLFYFALVYPPVWRFLFDSADLNALPDAERSKRVVSTAILTALLMATNAMVVALGIVAPGSGSLESTLLVAIAKTYLLVPVAALVLAPVLIEGGASGAAPEDGPKPSTDAGNA